MNDAELKSHDLEEKLQNLGSDCKGMIPRESIGTINSKSTADVSMCLRSKSFYRANSSGFSSLPFDKSECITPITREMGEKLNEM